MDQKKKVFESGESFGELPNTCFNHVKICYSKPIAATSATEHKRGKTHNGSVSLTHLR